MKLAFELEEPDGAVDKTAKLELVRSVREQAALKLYAEQRITTGEASEMLGLTRIQFLDLLHRSGTGFRVELDDEDFQMLRRWREDHDFQERAVSVSDSSPLNYLALLSDFDLLHQVYGTLEVDLSSRSA